MRSHETRTSSDGWCAANDQRVKTRLQGPIAKPQDGLGPNHMLGNPPQQMPLVKGLFRVRDAREIAPFQAKIRVFCCPDPACAFPTGPIKGAICLRQPARLCSSAALDPEQSTQEDRAGS